MENNNENKPVSLVPWQNNSLQRANNTLRITRKIIDEKGSLSNTPDSGHETELTITENELRKRQKEKLKGLDSDKENKS